MNPTTLHYVYDPLCGWCYAAAPLVRAAREALPVVAHGGGMLTGASRKRVSPEWRDYVAPQDRRIAELTGQAFGHAYQEGLLRDPTAMLDSEPPTTAILAAEQAAGRGLDFLAAVQKAHYLDGRHVADLPVLNAIAGELGLEPIAFEAAYEGLRGEGTRAHFAESRALLARVGGGGFPTFFLEIEGRRAAVDVAPYFRDPEAWKHTLLERVGGIEALGRG